MTGRPPRSPLFPYTPLFRSVQRGRSDPDPGAIANQAGPGPSGLVAPGLPGLRMGQCLGAAQGNELSRGPAADGQRWLASITPALEKEWLWAAPVWTQFGLRPQRAGERIGESSGVSGFPEGERGKALVSLE